MATYIVDYANGSDSNNGLSTGTAFKTLNKLFNGNTGVARAGDLIRLRGRNICTHSYYGGGANWEWWRMCDVALNQGSSGNPITIETYPGDEPAVWSGAGDL